MTKWTVQLILLSAFWELHWHISPSLWSTESISRCLNHLGYRACTKGSAWTRGRAGTTFQFCTSDGLFGVWWKHNLWCHPSGLIDLNEHFLVHAPIFGACSKKDCYRIKSGAWWEHQVVCGAWRIAPNNGSEFYLMQSSEGITWLLGQVV